MRRLYQSSLIVAIIGLIISFFVFQYGRSATVVDENEQNDENNNVYTYEIAFSLTDDLELEVFANSDQNDINLAIADQMMYFDDAMSVRMVDIIIKGYECKYPLIAGRYPSETQIKNKIPCVVLGKKLKRNTYSRGGNDYIKICGDEYLVTGYISADNSTILDYRTILYYESSGNGVKRELEYYREIPGWTFLMQSDVINEDELLDRLHRILGEDMFNHISIIDGYWHFVSSESVDTEHRNMANIICIFSICMVMLVVYYRLMCRKKEFAIKKAFGYTNLAIVMDVFIELFLCVFFAIVISEIIMTIMNIISKEVIIFRVSNFFQHAVSIVMYVAIVMPALIAVPVFKIVSYNPIKLLLDKR